MSKHSVPESWCRAAVKGGTYCAGFKYGKGKSEGKAQGLEANVTQWSNHNPAARAEFFHLKLIL